MIASILFGLSVFQSCPDGMVRVDNFCIDRYEAPNVKGAMPISAATAPEGERWCKARGKRLCSEAEWDRACEGPSQKPFPYGETYKKGLCNDDKEWIPPDWKLIAKYPKKEGLLEVMALYQADASGSRPGCVSDEGVYDLTANVAEWVTRSYEDSGPHDHVMKGCYWAGCFTGKTNPRCAARNRGHPGTFRSYEAGFRCCAGVE